MKKLLVFSCLIALIFGVLGTARALIYTDLEDLEQDLLLNWSLFEPDDYQDWTFDISEAWDNIFNLEVDSGDVAFAVTSLTTLNESVTVYCTDYLDVFCSCKGKRNCPVAPVPEPSVMLLLGCGFVCVAGFGWKRFSKKSTNDRQ